ncbi:MAG TPA: ATP-dependent helicase [Candidatus Paceibacterota bacterium]|nr:ATP-dependent helicase [Verrucomicrobiota bacterium]HRY48826.1 ATP-dependent helicase [Candidatus Paceibacterota bacterium]HRZ99638.1 ATP-dependent helicase [Candidatus Paceibacterota bacterium]
MAREYTLRPFNESRDLRIDYARELNDQQQAAVLSPPGPALVLAGAGSGKTRTLIYRVAYLLEQGIPPERLLLLTFTNKAAKEMMNRVTDLLGGTLMGLWGGTFHSIGNRVLRGHAAQIGFRPEFSILDREDANALIKACVNEVEPAKKPKGFPKPDVLSELISLAINTRKSLAEMVNQRFPQFSEFLDELEAIARAYQARKRADNAMDFDDLLERWFELMSAHSEIAEDWQRRFQFVLVDEYQDTNQLQSDLVDLLVARHRNVMAVGDDAQSIYSWRGANFQNILRFPQRYPEAVVFKIEKNYRSSPEILAVANAAIRANVQQFAKELTPVCSSGTPPALVVCADAEQQAAFVAQRILELHEQGASLQGIAVLYRSHFHALELQMELTRRGIPFQITSGIRFFEQAHIKDISAYLRLVHNPRDEPAFKRLILTLPGIGPKAAERMWKTFQEVLQIEEGGTMDLTKALRRVQTAIPKKAQTDWSQQQTVLEQIAQPDIKNRPGELIRWILEAGYSDYVKSNYTNHRSRLDDLEQLAIFAQGFAGTEEFLSQLALLSGVDTEGNPAFAEQEGQIKLSTVHQAKGLEFDIVFVIMLCEGLFPHARAVEEAVSEEEERRLFYVAVTRARRELYLSYPLLRFRGGFLGSPSMIPSRFLREIDAQLVEEWRLHPHH